MFQNTRPFLTTQNALPTISAVAVKLLYNLFWHWLLYKFFNELSILNKKLIALAY